MRINEGRHSFAGFESISKRDQDLNDILKKNCEKPTDLKLKGVSSDKTQISSIYYSTKPETSSPYSKTANEEEDDSKSVCLSDSDFPPIENLAFQKQLRVLNVLNESFEIDMVSLYNEFMLTKNRNKRKYFQNNFAQFEKNRVKRKWLEKMNQLKKRILFFDFLENHYVSKDEVSKQHLNVIKRSNFFKEDKTIVRSSHQPLETVLITCQNSQNQKTEVKASLSKLLMLKPLSLVLLNKTILLMNPYMLLVNSLIVLKKKLLKNCFS